MSAPGHVVIALCALLSWGCGREPERPPVDRVVLITLDTLRADRVGAYGDKNAETPTLDRLAAAGVRFDQAIAPTPITRPSHASMLTGLEPPEHGVRGNSVFSLDPTIPTVGEHFQQGGYGTAAFVAAFVLDSQFGLDRGFDVYDDDIGQRRAAGSPFSYAERRGDLVVDAALDWVREAPEKFFLWVHLYDPHANYNPPEPFAGRHRQDPYAGEIAFSDAQVARLLAGIRRRFGFEKLAIIVTSDHGEALGEHGEATHSLTVYDATQRVPLIISGPGLGRGAVVDDQVRSADIAPTLLELADLPPLPDTTGKSLVPLALGAEPESERVAYVEALEPQISMGWSPVLGIRAEGYKYLRAPRPELYDLAADPNELRNVAAEQPERVEAFDRKIDEVLARARGNQGGAELTAEDRARLESLGYLMPGSEGVDLTELGVVGGPDPKDHMQEASAMQRAAAHLSDGRGDQALALLAPIEQPGRHILLMRANAGVLSARYDIVVDAGRRLVEIDPLMSVHHYVLGLGLIGQGELEEAEAAFRETAAQDPESPSGLIGLGRVAHRRGDREQARAFFEQATALEDPPGGARFQLALLAFESGDTEAADAHLAALSPSFLGQAETQARIAHAETQAGRQDAAIARLRRLTRREPTSQTAWSSLALSLQHAGQLEEAVDAWRQPYGLDPNDPRRQNDLAWGLAVAGQSLEEALRLARSASAALGTPESLDTLASVHLARGEAAACLEIVRGLLPDAPAHLTPHLRYLEASALAALDRPGEARASLAQIEASELEPPFSERARALAAKLSAE